jgi:hypothetical protein
VIPHLHPRGEREASTLPVSQPVDASHTFKPVGAFYIVQAFLPPKGKA